MYNISDQQIDFILADLTAHGIGIESLRDNLLDHICIMIEENLAAEGDFQAFYTTNIRTFYRQELHEIEEETLLLLTFKDRLVFSRNQFFLLLFAVLIGPFICYDIMCMWMLNMGQTHTWNMYEEIWDGTLVFALYPLLVYLILLLTPDRFDPLIPKRSKVLIGIKPFIQIIPAEADPVLSYRY